MMSIWLRLIMSMGLCLLLLTACGPRPYWLSIHEEKLARYQGITWSNAVPLPDWYHLKSRAVLVPQDALVSPLLQATVSLIEARELRKLKKALAEAPAHDPYLPFCEGLHLFFTKKYRDAVPRLRANQVSVLQPMAEILVVDCQYQQTSAKTSRETFAQLQDGYQAIIDRYDLSDAYLALINHRLHVNRY